MRYKGSARPLPEIARELGVEGVVRGLGRPLGRAGAHHRPARPRPHRSPSLGPQLRAPAGGRARAAGRAGPGHRRSGPHHGRHEGGPAARRPARREAGRVRRLPARPAPVEPAHGAGPRPRARALPDGHRQRPGLRPRPRRSGPGLRSAPGLRLRPTRDGARRTEGRRAEGAWSWTPGSPRPAPPWEPPVPSSGIGTGRRPNSGAPSSWTRAPGRPRLLRLAPAVAWTSWPRACATTGGRSSWTHSTS